MKNLRTLAALAVFVFTSDSHAESPATFEGEITGLVCASCKQEVVTALSKMDGVKNVEITPSNNPEIRRIVIASTREDLTQANVNETLEKVGKEFKVTKLARAAAAQNR